MVKLAVIVPFFLLSSILVDTCHEMIHVLKWLKTMHHSFNMVYHRVNRGVEGGPGFDQIEPIVSWLSSCWLCMQWQSAARSDLFSKISYYIFLSVWLYSSLAPNINKIKQAKIKIGKILVEGAIKENVTCICVWGFYKNDLRCVVWFWMSVFSGCLIICFLLNLILGASSSEFHSISSTSESPQNQEELKKWKQKTKIVETEKLKGENKIKRCIKLLWKVFVNSNNYLLVDKALKNYLNAVMWHVVLF